MAMGWSVVATYSGFEKQVGRSLKEHIRNAGMDDKFGEILVPMEEVVELKSGQKRTSERKFFPGYVLVHMEMSDETWHLVKNVPKVSGFIGGFGTHPTPVTDKEEEGIVRQGREGAGKTKPKFSFMPGELVRVTEGPFQDFNGTVEDVNYEKNKVKVSVSIFGRMTPVELDFSQVEKA